MERISHWLAWATVAVIVLFAGLNWSVLSAPAALNLVAAEVQAPVGVILLAMTAVFVALFIVATLYSRIGTLLETRRLLKEVQQARNLAEQAEASRLENLHQLIATEFRLLNERLGSLTMGVKSNAAPSDETSAEKSAEFSPVSLSAIVTGRGAA